MTNKIRARSSESLDLTSNSKSSHINSDINPINTINNPLYKLIPTIIKERKWGILLWLVVIVFITAPLISILFSFLRSFYTDLSPIQDLEEIKSFLPTYIEILAGLLAFGVGIPSLLMNVPSRIRVLHRKHADKVKFFFYKKDLIVDDFFNPVLASAIIVFSILFLGFWLIPCDIFIFNICGLQYYLQSWFPSVILFGNIFLVARFVIILRSHNKFEFLNDLEKKIRSHKKTVQVTLDPQILESISELGQYAEAGSDKDTVLSTLKNLKNTHGLSYETRAKLAESIRTVVIGGSADNFIVAIQLLQQMCDRVAPVIFTVSARDQVFLTAIFSELEEVLFLGFAHSNPKVHATMLEAYPRIAFQLSPRFARSFLRLGHEALKVKSMRAAQHILRKFDTKINEIFFPKRNQPIRNYRSFSTSEKESLYRFFGLLSYFWHERHTARQLAHEYIEDLDSNEIDKYLQHSKNFFKVNGEVENADYIEKMLFEYRQFQYVKKFLLKIPELKPEEQQRIAVHYDSFQKLLSVTKEDILACGVSEAATTALLQKLKPPSP